MKNADEFNKRKEEAENKLDAYLLMLKGMNEELSAENTERDIEDIGGMLKSFVDMKKGK